MKNQMFYTKNNAKTMVISVAVNIKPSILSITPPWPGKIFPKSLTPTLRFRADSQRSPSWVSNEPKSPTIANIAMYSVKLSFMLAEKYGVK